MQPDQRTSGRCLGLHVSGKHWTSASSTWDQTAGRTFECGGGASWTWGPGSHSPPFSRPFWDKTVAQLLWLARQNPCHFEVRRRMPALSTANHNDASSSTLRRPDSALFIRLSTPWIPALLDLAGAAIDHRLPKTHTLRFLICAFLIRVILVSPSEVCFRTARTYDRNQGFLGSDAAAVPSSIAEI
jgi:hypothetical protein